MTTTKTCRGLLSYVQTVTQEAPAAVDEDGNLTITDGYDMIDVEDSGTYCDLCGIITDLNYAKHGLSAYWEVV